MNDRLVRISEVVRLIGMSPSTIRRLEQKGDFPHRLHISTNVVAWRLREVMEWIESRQVPGGRNSKP